MKLPDNSSGLWCRSASSRRWRAAKVLGESGEPMNCPAMIEAMAAKGYWKSPGGQTPHATLYSALLREINTKGKESRFKKTERGKFALNA